jgi:hypothetical protein
MEIWQRSSNQSDFPPEKRVMRRSDAAAMTA